MEIKQRLIPAHLTNTRPGYKLIPEYFTIHETDNTEEGADAEAHAKLQERGNSRQASWHLQVDEKEAIQSIPFNENCWAAGDGGTGPGNRKSIHLEICVNSDGDYKKACQNAAIIAAQVMKQYNIPISKLVQHNKWSGKNCPSIMRSGKKGITWSLFVSWVAAYLNPQPQVNKEVVELEKTAIVVNSFGDAYAAEPLAKHLGCGIFFRDTAASRQVAETVFVCGGSKEGLKGSNFVELTGPDRWEAAKAIGDYTKKH